MSEAWRCPDCAEEVAADATVCPYCGCTAAAGGDESAASQTPAQAQVADAGPAVPAGPEKTAATRLARYGHCPSCGRSQWEGAVAGRCVTCGAQLQSLQVVEVPMTSGGEPQGPSGTAQAQRLAGAATVAPTGSAGQATSTAAPAGAPADAIALLRQLAALRDEDVITNEEFEAKKAEILRRL